MTLDEYKKTQALDDHDIIFTKKHKTGKGGPAPTRMTPTMKVLMRMYMKKWRPHSKGNFVFVNSEGKQLALNQIGQFWKDHLKKCDIGLAELSMSKWRRTTSSEFQWNAPHLIDAIRSIYTHGDAEQQSSYRTNIPVNILNTTY